MFTHTREVKNLRGEAEFLQGRHVFWKEIARIFRMLFEFLRGFWGFRDMGPAITFFGSARLGEKSPYYELARKICFNRNLS